MKFSIMCYMVLGPVKEFQEDVFDIEEGEDQELRVFGVGLRRMDA